jgi:hypothetical protein
METGWLLSRRSPTSIKAMSEATVSGELVRETDKALLVKVKNGEFWLPKSQTTSVLRQGADEVTHVTIKLPVWLAEKAGVWYD